MACRFCPKIKKFDIVFIIIACLAFYALNTYQSHRREKQRLEAFEKLQKDCLYGDNKACQKIYGEK